MNTAAIKLYDLFRKELNLDESKAKEFVDRTISEEIRQDKNEIVDAKNDMIKWLVGLFFALAMMIIGLYIKG
ncbi:hypothetical protein [Flavobacterium sp. HBTb2-11-1]|uniref:hypothetical protein n=1 Tax=Flavobacterium sp. HBTb2-11-1 TaxID=2692212 RepID=UPI0013C1405D|nr:hypothetical protein [Flavobacterium sp. HBTb2-11-1]MXO03535.1 hypothetical protein [Flavobacterium sp. HBTb2-11-1]